MDKSSVMFGVKVKRGMVHFMLERERERERESPIPIKRLVATLFHTASYKVFFFFFEGKTPLILVHTHAKS